MIILLQKARLNKHTQQVKCKEEDQEEDSAVAAEASAVVEVETVEAEVASAVVVVETVEAEVASVVVVEAAVVEVAIVVVVVDAVVEVVSVLEPQSRSRLMFVSRASTTAEARMMCYLPRTLHQARVSTMRSVLLSRYVKQLNHLHCGPPYVISFSGQITFTSDVLFTSLAE